MFNHFDMKQGKVVEGILLNHFGDQYGLNMEIEDSNIAKSFAKPNLLNYC